MASQDLKNRISPVQSLAPASRTVAVNGTGVDLQGYESAAVNISLGAIGGTTPSFTFAVDDSDDNTTFAAVAAANLDGAAPVVTTSENTEKVLGYHGGKRYVRVAITAVTGTGPTLLCGASVIRGHGRRQP